MRVAEEKAKLPKRASTRSLSRRKYRGGPRVHTHKDVPRREKSRVIKLDNQRRGLSKKKKNLRKGGWSNYLQ